MKKSVLVFSSLLILFSFSHFSEDKDTKNTTVVPPPEALISSEVSTLDSSANAAWAVMAKADSQKFADIRRLLQEISYCKKYNEKEYEYLMKETNSVYGMRYTISTLSDSTIVAYDSATTILVQKVRALKSKTPEILQHPLAEQLENEIMKAETEDIIRYRNNYDRAAQEYNTYLDKHQEALSKSGTTYIKKPLFAVML